ESPDVEQRTRQRQPGRDRRQRCGDHLGRPRMKHLLDTGSLTRAEAIGILDIAEEMTLVSEREVKKLPVLRGRTVVNLFFEDSTRTRLSFEAAAKRLSADVLNFSAKGSSVSKGESLQDTIQTISAVGADAIVVRHSGAGTAHRLAHTGWIDVPVVNAGDGTHEHPTQALLDAFSLRGALAGAPSSPPPPSGGPGPGCPPLRRRPTVPAVRASTGPTSPSSETSCIRGWRGRTSTRCRASAPMSTSSPRPPCCPGEWRTGR